MSKLYILHRWLGLTAGLMLVVWYGSGLYVHWRALPSVLSVEEQRRTIGVPFALSEAEKDFPEILKVYGDGPAQEVRLRRAGSRLIYEVRGIDSPGKVFDATTGALLSPIGEAFAQEIAQGFMPATAIKASILLEMPDAYSIRLSMPVYRITFSDDQSTAVYVDPATASILSRTRTRERLYYVFGSIPHFLNMNLPFLQHNKTVKDGLLFVLNALAGLVVFSGIAMAAWMIARHGFLGRPGLKHSLLCKLHYFLGLGFTVTSLLFITSGLFYVVNGSPPPVRVTPKPEELRPIAKLINLANLRPARQIGSGEMRNPPGLSMVVLKQVLDVPLYQFHHAGGGSSVMKGDTGQPFAVDSHWLHKVVNVFLGSTDSVGEVQYLTDYDTYYYARDGRFPVLPVYRIQGNDSGQTIVYLSPATGEVVGRASRDFRVFRWFVSGFHAWDWPFLLQRPVLRDGIVVLLVIGGLGVSLTGLYLGIANLKS